MKLTKIGTFESCFKELFGIPRQSSLAPSVQGKITAFQGLGVFAGPLLGGWLLKYGSFWAFAPGIFCALVGAYSAFRLSPAVDRETGSSFYTYMLRSYGQWFEVLTGRPIIQLGMLLVAMTSFFLYVTGWSISAVTPCHG